MRINSQNDQQTEIALIFEQILPTNTCTTCIRKCVEISQENLSVDTGAQGVNITDPS